MGSWRPVGMTRLSSQAIALGAGLVAVFASSCGQPSAASQVRANLVTLERAVRDHDYATGCRLFLLVPESATHRDIARYATTLNQPSSRHDIETFENQCKTKAPQGPDVFISWPASLNDVSVASVKVRGDVAMVQFGSPQHHQPGTLFVSTERGAFSFPQARVEAPSVSRREGRLLEACWAPGLALGRTRQAGGRAGQCPARRAVR